MNGFARNSHINKAACMTCCCCCCAKTVMIRASLTGSYLKSEGSILPFQRLKMRTKIERIID